MTKIILFPYAGSLGLGYSQWIRPLEKKFEVHRIVYTELKDGLREYRPLSWDELSELMFQRVVKMIGTGDYILFGHSMGSRAVYEMYRKIVEHKLPLPKRLIFSGCRTLSYGIKGPENYTEEEFKTTYIALGGISDQVLECEELAELAFSDLRKDVTLLSQFQYEPVEMKCPVTVWNGSRDKISSKKEWETLLGIEIEWEVYEGKHFFIYDYQDEIIQKLCSFAE